MFDVTTGPTADIIMITWGWKKEDKGSYTNVGWGHHIGLVEARKTKKNLRQNSLKPHRQCAELQPQKWESLIQALSLEQPAKVPYSELRL